MNPELIIDCGAFTFWGKGGTTDPDAYIAFLKENAAFYSLSISLDEIPGSYGRRDPHPESIEAAAAQTYCNHQRMKESGLCPVPIFHQDEHFRWLRRYLEDRDGYIALSPSARAHRNQIIPWLTCCFKVIGDARVKTHALGLTSPLLMHKFAFTSVDSRRWGKQSEVGAIPVVHYTDDNQPDYAIPPDVVSVTARSRHRPNHISKWDVAARASRFLEEEVGTDLHQCGLHQLARLKAWLVYYRGLELSSGTAIFQVTNFEKTQTAALDQCGVTRRLLSYYYLRDSSTALSNYVAGRRRQPLNPAPKVKKVLDPVATPANRRETTI